MRRITKIQIILLMTLGILFPLTYLVNNKNNLNMGFNSENSFINQSLKVSKISAKIHINNNWSAAQIEGICNGSGTYSDPYVIEDLIIDGGERGSCIWIENSDVHFKIQNCTFYNAGFGSAGIYLDNTSNGQLINNNCSHNNHMGISLLNCNNALISGNNANCNYYSGPLLIYIIGKGISLTGTNNTLLLNNNVNYNQHGIELVKSNKNVFSENTVINNYHGTFLRSGTYNTLYYNNFTCNSLHAIDDGLNNQWDNGSIGNYWDNYTGVDNNDDGIGDTPHIIAGTAHSQDNFPIWNDGPESKTPTISGFGLFFLLGIHTILSIIIVKKIRKYH